MKTCVCGSWRATCLLWITSGPTCASSSTSSCQVSVPCFAPVLVIQTWTRPNLLSELYNYWRLCTCWDGSSAFTGDILSLRSLRETITRSNNWCQRLEEIQSKTTTLQDQIRTHKTSRRSSVLIILMKIYENQLHKLDALQILKYQNFTNKIYTKFKQLTF